MTTMQERLIPVSGRGQWADLATPGRTLMRSMVASRLLRYVATHAGIRVDMTGSSKFGPSDGPRLIVRRPQDFLARLGRDGKVGFGESYMAGDWESPDLVGVLERIAEHADTIVPPSLQWLRRFYDARHPEDEDNDRRGSRRNIVRHYDLSNELFSCFLDETMSYSSGLFSPGVVQAESLVDAQARKIERLLDVTGVKPGTRVLEIGTGWGELALRAGRRGARVTSVTLSDEQARMARKRIASAGLDPLVDVLVQDYRDVVGKYDVIVSVEMIEAVGERWWPTYFHALDMHLAPGGRVGVQAILMPHDRLMASKSSWTWIHKYIFPGGLIPSVEVIDQMLASHTSLRAEQHLLFGASYAETLRRWREEFQAQSERIDALGFDETFRRMWTFYLAYCEAGFRSGYLDVGQFVFTRPNERWL